jgi:replicative DNA helicase
MAGEGDRRGHVADKGGGEASGVRVNLKRVVVDRRDQIQADRFRVMCGEKVFTHVPTGLRAFDTRFGGLEVGILTLVVGHTGDGKTSFMLQLAKGAAQAGFGVLVFLLEDPADKVADRLMASVMGTSANLLGRLQVDISGSRGDSVVQALDWTRRVDIREGYITGPEVLRIVEETTEVDGAPLGLVIVDYAQGLQDDDGRMEQVCAGVARALNTCARVRKFATVLGSQVKSEVFERGRSRWEYSMRKTGEAKDADVGGFRPGKGDVMWARRMEQYSKAVWYLFRPGRWRRELGDASANDNTMDVNVGKANYSPEGMETFEWEGVSCTIRDRMAA